tara:strand:- start:314 stop:484 length:171 start_codon:yes stop_codon:yes gene_type:complete
LVKDVSAMSKKNKNKIKSQFKPPKIEPYIGTMISADLGGIKVSNPSYKKYYKDLIK